MKISLVNEAKIIILLRGDATKTERKAWALWVRMQRYIRGSIACNTIQASEPTVFLFLMPNLSFQFKQIFWLDCEASYFDGLLNAQSLGHDSTQFPAIIIFFPKRVFLVCSCPALLIPTSDLITITLPTKFKFKHFCAKV